MDINQANMELFWHYVQERQSIYLKRQRNEPGPWTSDPILQKYKFTNVFRDLDPGTHYVIERIIPRCTNLEDLVFNIIIYRLYNKIETFEHVGLQSAASFDAESFESKLRELKSSGTNVFTNAFIVSGYSWIDGKDKIEKTCNILKSISEKCGELAKQLQESKDSPVTFRLLRSLDGIGDFLSYQIAVDIGYARPDLFDESKFVVAGPGCRNGIDRIFANHDGYEECIRHLVEIQDEHLKNWNERRLNLMAIENCLCEFSKYCKAYRDEGRPRNRYRIKLG